MVSRRVKCQVNNIPNIYTMARRESLKRYTGTRGQVTAEVRILLVCELREKNCNFHVQYIVR